jgi:hypothetical protein
MSVSSIFGCGRGAKTRGSTCRIWVGMFAATLTTFVLVSLTVVLRVASQTTNTSELRLYALLGDGEPEVRFERVAVG